MHARIGRWSGWPLIALVAAWALAGCGGGGGSDDTDSIRTPLPSLSEDVDPAGDRLDLRARNYFALAAGNSWSYEQQRHGSATGLTLTRTATSGVGGDVVVTESMPGQATVSGTYRPSAAGWMAVAPFADEAPAAAAQRIGDLLEYPEPFFAPGGERRIVRQGNWGEDLDGDGHPESFRLEIVQVLVGFETLTLRNEPVPEVAHLRTVATLTLQPSSLAQQAQQVVSTDDEWWAPGIGLVRADRAAVDGTGAPLLPPYTLLITTATVDGRDPLEPKPDGSVVKLALLHNALTYDPTRNVYYASLPGQVAGHGHGIATVDAAGSVSHSAQAVGSEPWHMAVSATGASLFVALQGSGEIVRLRLPDMAEQWRARLPADAFQGQHVAQSLAASPVDDDVVAVATRLAGGSSSHAGVVLIRAGTVQPVATSALDVSSLIAFAGDGQSVFGFNTETTEFGLRRLAVLADGLRVDQVVGTEGTDFGTRSIGWSADGVVVGGSLYRAADLALLGQAIAPADNCRFAATARRMVCANGIGLSASDPALSVIDAASLATLAQPRYERGYGGAALWELIPGAPGQVALRMGSLYATQPAEQLWLFNSPLLP